MQHQAPGHATMLPNHLDDRDDDTDNENQQALRFILEAWEDALEEGIEAELLANAALFAALTDLVSTYGEDAVRRMTDGLSERIEQGEFTLYRTMQ